MYQERFQIFLDKRYEYNIRNYITWVGKHKKDFYKQEGLSNDASIQLWQEKFNNYLRGVEE